MSAKMKTNRLYYGDCLAVMEKFPPASVDLIYLDPPFNSDANYNIIFHNKTGKKGADDSAQTLAFSDTWEWGSAAKARVDNIKSAVGHAAHKSISAFAVMWPEGSGMLAYLSYMAERLAAMKTLLKDSGSIYLHCDPTASHYLKMLMDDIFGAKNYRNEIVWCYRFGAGGKKQFRRKHDIVLFYSRGKNHLFNYEAVLVESRSNWAKQNKIKTVVDVDWWNIPSINNNERLGYPTQKPIALLNRIIQASSSEGGIVLDPFCGCGTTIEAAHNLKRRWLGIDISTYALEVICRERMKNIDIPREGIPASWEAARLFEAQSMAHDKIQTMEDARLMEPFAFERFAITRLPGFWPNQVQVGDHGIDGRAMIFHKELDNRLIIAQVKKSDHATLDAVRAFAGAIMAGKAAMGVFITLEKFDTPAVRKCIAEAGVLEIGASKFNRLVMYSLREFFSGNEPKLPALAHPRTGKPFQDALPADK
ncbi:MAG: DNA methyltransferase [Gammaproteobacteria bacterium]|nr:DNA methyltransferase [Gammaproteobacteria bacterium]